MSKILDEEYIKQKSLQLGDMASGPTVIGTVTNNSWIVLRTLKLRAINGRSTAWLSTYVPQFHSFCVPFLEYCVQCTHCTV